MIQLEGICVDFGGLRAIDHASFKVDAGRVTGLIGPNGAGKTTAFNVIAGAVRPSAGRVLFDGEDITGLKPYQRAIRGLARTFQIPHEFSRLTVLENLMAAAAAEEGDNVFNVVFRRGRFNAEQRAIYDHAREMVAVSRDRPCQGREGGQPVRRPEESCSNSAAR
jgi:branched-chain amino acid transport system ATP-binding protein